MNISPASRRTTRSRASSTSSCARDPVGDLKFVKATHNSPYGLIASEWHRDGNKFDWQIEIPANTTATVYVPATKLENVKAAMRRPHALKMAARF